MHKFKKSIFAAVLLCSFSATTVLASSSEVELKYRRSALFSVLLIHPEQDYCDSIVKVFKEIPIPEKYDDHNLPWNARIIKPPILQIDKSTLDKQQEIIEKFIAQKRIAARLVAKWFNRKKDGTFDMNLIAERGLYDASYFDVKLADMSVRGRNMLADAGEELIGNTYLVVNDIRYVDTSERGSLIVGILGAVADQVTGGIASTIAAAATTTGAAISSRIAGFKVLVVSYLYRLDWSDEIATTFYRDFYINNPDAARKDAFEKGYEIFKLHYIGRQVVNARKTTLNGVGTEGEMIKKVCTRAIDKAVAQLQKEHEEFRVKTPLFSVTPLSAKIGIKEDVDEQSRFEVLEMYEGNDGRTSYKRVGVIRPRKGYIWDNRYLAEYEDENKNSNLTATEFEVVNGKDFAPGMLIREIK